MDIRVERGADGTLGAYGSVAYAAHDTLLADGPIEEPVGRFDLNKELPRWLEHRPRVP